MLVKYLPENLGPHIKSISKPNDIGISILHIYIDDKPWDVYTLGKEHPDFDGDVYQPLAVVNTYVNDVFIKMLNIISDFEINKDFKIVMIRDMLKYREFAICEYNGNDKKATNEFMARKFLQHFYVGVKLFCLHSECYNEKEFNKLLSCLYIILARKPGTLYFYKDTWLNS